MSGEKVLPWEVPEGWEGDPLTPEEIELFEIFECEGINPFDRCVGCEEHWIDIYRSRGRDWIEYREWSSKKGGSICIGCREADDYHPCGTVVVYDPAERTAVKYVVGIYNDERWDGPEDMTADDTDLGAGDFCPSETEESPIQFEWHGFGYRGYYNPVVPDGWRHLHEDCILSGSGDELALKEFHVEVKRLLWGAGVKFAVVYGTTSNLFSTGYDVLVEASEDELKTLALLMRVSQLRLRHRDRSQFVRTALTGSSEDTEHGRLMVKAYDMLQAGSSLDEVLAEVREDA